VDHYFRIRIPLVLECITVKILVVYVLIGVIISLVYEVCCTCDVSAVKDEYISCALVEYTV